jgi:hypothetical protein
MKEKIGLGRNKKAGKGFEEKNKLKTNLVVFSEPINLLEPEFYI